MNDEVSMIPNSAANWYHNSRINTQNICEHCGRMGRHEKWCVTCDPLVHYAYGVVTDPERLTLRDRLILHALGVEWDTTPCKGCFEQVPKI